MWKKTGFPALAPVLPLALALLAGCAAPAPGETPDVPGDLPAVDCRIVDGAGSGSLLLAAVEGDGVYRCPEEQILLNDRPADAAELRDGMLVRVLFSGTVRETYPMGFDGISALCASGEGVDDRCGLYLQVLEDLWETDSGLNEGVSELGMDLSGVTDLSGAEKAAVVWRFGELRGIAPVTGTWGELAEQGYIDAENLQWEDGVFFSVTGSAQEGFRAEKWRDGTGAYYFTDCTAEQGADGSWTYAVGGHAIA